MASLPAELLEFVRELELNNDRDWFQANKKRYEEFVKAPSERFASIMIDRMREFFPDLDIAPKDTLFRIYRDVRFSKDKSPYKTHIGMAIGPKGRKDFKSPGCYFHVGPRELFFGSGFYMLEPHQLKAMRQFIAQHASEFKACLDAEPFRRLLGTVLGERAKVLPLELKADAAAQPLLYNKQFYYGATYGAEEALRPDLDEFLMQHMRAAAPMNRLLEQALV